MFVSFCSICRFFHFCIRGHATQTFGDLQCHPDSCRAERVTLYPIFDSYWRAIRQQSSAEETTVSHTVVT